MAEFGIDTENMFGFWDWVGGRYSVDSAIGLSLMIVHRAGRRSAEFLDGFHTIDQHFVEAPLHANVPVIMAHARRLVHQRARRADARPCCRTPTSCAASRRTCSSSTWRATASRVRLDGSPVSTTDRARSCGASRAPTASTRSTNCSTRAPGWCRSTSSASPSPNHTLYAQHDLLVANLFAQGEALAFGKTLDEVIAEGIPEHQQRARVFPGNRPTTTILPPRLTPRCSAS